MFALLGLILTAFVGYSIYAHWKDTTGSAPHRVWMAVVATVVALASFTQAWVDSLGK
jgi:hypothetical protein